MIWVSSQKLTFLRGSNILPTIFMLFIFSFEHKLQISQIWLKKVLVLWKIIHTITDTRHPPVPAYLFRGYLIKVRALAVCLQTPSGTDVQCRSLPAGPNGDFHAMFMTTERNGGSGKFTVFCFLRVGLGLEFSKLYIVAHWWVIKSVQWVDTSIIF